MMPAARCPLCAKSVVAEHAPFCSPGCRDRDLLAWLSEGYRLPDRTPAADRLDSIEQPD